MGTRRCMVPATRYTVPEMLSSLATLLAKNRPDNQVNWQMTYQASLLRITIVYVKFHITYIR